MEPSGHLNPMGISTTMTRTKRLKRICTASFAVICVVQMGVACLNVEDKRVEPAEHKKFVQAEVARFGPVIKAAGVYAD